MAPPHLRLSRHGTLRFSRFPCQSMRRWISYRESAEVGKAYAPYLRNFLKKLIVEVESIHGEVLDEIYELYADIITSLKDDQFVEKSMRVHKTITFLFPDGCIDLPSCPKSRKLMVPLQCSLNMLEGDTGCSIWPSSLLLSEFILSFPEIFSNKSCFEVGSGVGLVGICLAHVKASKALYLVLGLCFFTMSPAEQVQLVIAISFCRIVCIRVIVVTLTDGDHLTLANMRSNLELNQLSTDTSLLESYEDPNVVQCVHLPWESASESGLSAFVPEIILGADILYDRSCFPDLVRILAILLNRRKSDSSSRKESTKGFTLDTKCNTNDLNDLTAVTSKGPVAYIATVIRNIDTFNYFLSLVEQANLSITDLTEAKMPFNLLPYMQSYDRSNMRLFTVSSKA
ncbi:protein-lysine n-methyltransferase eef2kmt [Citrus sinensis]|uniref:Protein-lysine n-methyltransferase eef2kmt n=1 Tax=Citrus sinensis TaxID=2711 RepID=A0ACB8KJS0_CITSI|nr:protein-lysine n-methyltransferase eef2kmt [Citrus sinensis]